jgi:hypothetical protein
VEPEVKRTTIDDLNDDALLQIFSKLPQKVLAWRCSLVNKKWNRLAANQSFWRPNGIDLKNRQLKAVTVASALQRGVHAMRMFGTTVIGDLAFSQPLQLRYLDISCATISVRGLNQLLAANAVSLKKLSMESLDIDQKTLDILLDDHTELEVLNLSSVRSENAIMFAEKLPLSLRELNLGWTAPLNAVQMIPLLPKNLDRLNMSGHREAGFDDMAVEFLVKTCPHLTELDLSDCHHVTSNSLLAIETLRDLNTLKLSRCYLMNDFNDLLNMRSLRNLSVVGLDLDVDIPNLTVNEDLFSTVARPTVAPRRSTIWGIALN